MKLSTGARSSLYGDEVLVRPLYHICPNHALRAYSLVLEFGALGRAGLYVLKSMHFLVLASLCSPGFPAVQVYIRFFPAVSSRFLVIPRWTGGVL